MRDIAKASVGYVLKRINITTLGYRRSTANDEYECYDLIQKKQGNH